MIISFYMVTTLMRVANNQDTPLILFVAPMVRAITCTISMHEFALSAVFNFLVFIEKCRYVMWFG